MEQYEDKSLHAYIDIKKISKDVDIYIDNYLEILDTENRVNINDIKEKVIEIKESLLAEMRATIG